RTARAKGLGEWPVIVRHALKNAAIPIVTIIGLDVGTILGSAVITETVFAWPGLGRLAIDSIAVRDFPVVQADVFVIAVAFVVITSPRDVLFTWLDRRGSLDGGSAPARCPLRQPRSPGPAAGGLAGGRRPPSPPGSSWPRSVWPRPPPPGSRPMTPA